MFRAIAISLSPNTEEDDILLALRTLFSPQKWLDGKEVKLFEQEFAREFGSKYKALAINSGRSAQYLILKALGVGKKDEVAIQAFTCVSVPNSVIWTSARPVYIDIDKTYNMDPNDLARKLTSKTRTVIVQHTFGYSANMEKIKKITQKRGMQLLEDCSHSLGARYKGKLVGTLGDVSFFSFGRDKILSSVFGGVILCPNGSLYKKLKKMRDRLDNPSKRWIVQQLFHPLAFSFILPLYSSGIGKLTLLLLQKAGFLSKAVCEDEKLTKKPRIFPTQMPGGLAVLARNQLRKLKRFNKHRQKIAEYYASSLKGLELHLPSSSKEAVWLRFPIRLKQIAALFEFSKERSILLGDWYRGVVMPVRNLKLVGYRKGTCPVAEEYGERVINLPTYPTLSKKQAKKVVGVIKQWQSIK